MNPRCPKCKARMSRMKEHYNSEGSTQEVETEYFKCECGIVRREDDIAES